MIFLLFCKLRELSNFTHYKSAKPAIDAQIFSIACIHAMQHVLRTLGYADNNLLNATKWKINPQNFSTC